MDDDRPRRPRRDAEERPRPPWSRRWDTQLADLDARIRGVGTELRVWGIATAIFAILIATEIVFMGAKATVFSDAGSTPGGASRGIPTSSVLWAYASALCVGVAIVLFAMIARSDRTIVEDAARAAVVMIPIAVLADVFAYVFNLGWAASFSIPLARVPLKGSLLTVIAEFVVTCCAFALVASVSLTPEQRKAKENEPKTDFDWKRIRAVIPEQRRAAAGAAIIAIAALSFLAGFRRFSVPSSWSYIDKGCVIVAVFGDTVIAADVDNDGRVAADFTTYDAGSTPRYWQSKRAFTAVVRPDSDIQKKPLFKCPLPAERHAASTSKPSKPASSTKSRI